MFMLVFFFKVCVVVCGVWFLFGICIGGGFDGGLFCGSLLGMGGLIGLLCLGGGGFGLMLGVVGLG